jgi:hypothetical protein
MVDPTDVTGGSTLRIVTRVDTWLTWPGFRDVVTEELLSQEAANVANIKTAGTYNHLFIFIWITLT